MERTTTSISGDGRTIARDETIDLIASDKVEGTAVYDRAGRSVGEVHNFMVDKSTGQVAYAVISFGGFLGFGEDYFPLPWDALSYDTALGGYVTDVDDRRLGTAPRYGRDDAPWTDPGYTGGLNDFWGRPYTM
jgi:sporulation protein YlmC with PRC-barrel domain